MTIQAASDNVEIAPPISTVPLGYFEQRSEPWLPLVRFAAWVAIAYASGVVVSQSFLLLIYLMQMSPSTMLSLRYLASLPEAIAGLVILVGGFMSIRLHRAGRLLVLWATGIITVIWGLTFIVEVGGFLLNYSYPASMGRFFIMYRLLNLFVSLLNRAFVPVMLFVLFRRREVREAFGGRLH